MRKHGCHRSLSEALASELKGWVWQIVSKRHTETGWEVSYRAVTEADWDQIQKLPRASWPIMPELVSRPEATRQWNIFENIMWVAVGILAVSGIVTESMGWGDLMSRQWTLIQKNEDMGKKVAAGEVVQHGWVKKINAFSQKAAMEGVTLKSFDWSAQGVSLELEGGDAKVQGALLKDWDSNARKEGALWRCKG